MTNKELLQTLIKSSKKVFPDLDFTKITFHINKKIFRHLGYFIGLTSKTRQGAIHLSSVLFDYYDGLLSVFNHELIHAWQYQTFGYVDHAESFKHKRNEIQKKLNLNLEISITYHNKMIQEILNKQLQNNNQYRIKDKTNKNVYLFAKNLTSRDIVLLKNHSFDVWKNTGKQWIDVRHVKNIETILQRTYRKCYYPDKDYWNMTTWKKM